MVLVNRGWVPSAWKDQLPPQADAKRPVKVVGVIQPNESPSQFVSENIPEDAEFHYINVAALVRECALVEKTMRHLQMTLMGHSSL